MNRFNMDPLELEFVTLSLEEVDDRLSLAISGELEIQDPSKIILPYMLEVHQALIDNGIDNINFDIRKLTFMNSSGIQTFINWFMNSRKLPSETRYTITIIYDADIMWQRSSIPVFQKLFDDLIKVKAE